MGYISKSYLKTQFDNFSNRLSDVFAKKNDLIEDNLKPISSKTYSGLYASSNTNGSGADFMPISMKPNNTTDWWKIKFKINANYTRSNDSINYIQSSMCEFIGYGNQIITYSIFNDVKNTSHRPYYSIIAYRPNTSGNDIIFGFTLYNTNNNTSTTNKRTAIIDLISVSNCVVTFHDTCDNTDYATYYKNMAGRSTYNGYDSGIKQSGDANDTTTLQMSTTKLKAGGTSGVGIYGYNLVMQDSSGNYQSLTKGNTTANTKVVNTEVGFIPNKIFLYWSGTNINVGSITGTSVVRTNQDWVDFRYISNSAQTLIINEPIYLKGKIKNGLFYVDGSIYSQTLPTTEDDFVYIYIGHAYSNYQACINLMTFTPLWYKDGNIKVYSESDGGGSDINDNAIVSSATPTSQNSGALWFEVIGETFNQSRIASAEPVLSIEQPTSQGTYSIWYEIIK